MKVHYTEDGDDNFYGIATENDWLARVQFNGELDVDEQFQLIHVMVDAISKYYEAAK